MEKRVLEAVKGAGEVLKAYKEAGPSSGALLVWASIKEVWKEYENSLFVRHLDHETSSATFEETPVWGLVQNFVGSMEHVGFDLVQTPGFLTELTRLLCEDLEVGGDSDMIGQGEDGYVSSGPSAPGYACVDFLTGKIEWSQNPIQFESFRRLGPKVGRNDKCPCESGKKFKKCCQGAVAR